LDRRFTFANPEIIALLQSKFVPAVGNTHEVQNQRFESSKWFMGMARSINPRVNNGVTAQGFYVAGADGTGYGFNNNRDPQRVSDFIKTGLEAFSRRPPVQVEIADDLLKSVSTRGPDPSTSVLQVYSRIKPLPEGCDELNKGIGRDFLWVYADEVKAIRAGTLPDDLVRRIARFHLVDNVRGEPDMWKPSEIVADLKLSRIGKDRFAIGGTFSMAAGQRGLSGDFEGEVTLDPTADRIADFKAYAKCEAWGAGTYTPKPPPGKFTLLFAIVPATADYAKVTPPQAATYGDHEYRHAASR
jgi:hypothetical protein